MIFATPAHRQVIEQALRKRMADIVTSLPEMAPFVEHDRFQPMLQKTLSAKIPLMIDRLRDAALPRHAE